MTITANMKRGLQMGLFFGALPLTSCMATVGAQRLQVPADSALICAAHCQSIGMRLSAVAIMAENVGCVCQLRSESRGSEGTAGQLGTPVAGMATIAMQRAAAAREQEQQRRRH